MAQARSVIRGSDFLERTSELIPREINAGGEDNFAFAKVFI